MGSRAPLTIVLLALGALGAWAPAADAGTVTLTTSESCECDDEGGTSVTAFRLAWAGASGEANTASVAWRADGFHVADTTAPVTAGAGCTQVSANEAACTTSESCPGARGVDCNYDYSVQLQGGDRDDSLSLGALPVEATGRRSVTTRIDGDAGADTVAGSALDDVLVGGGGGDTLGGGAGDDSFFGDEPPAELFAPPPSEPGAPPPAPATDAIDGGAGSDVVSYERRSGPVVVDLASGVAGDVGEDDRLSAVERATGGGGDDVLTGDAAANVLDGAGGSDRLDGSAGDDVLYGGPGSDALMGGAGADTLGGEGAPELAPSAAPDTLDGGDGGDTASWSGRPDPVRVDLADPGPDGEPAAPDTLTAIENVIGSEAADVLIGDARPNVLNGDFGSDRVMGGDGDDTLLADGKGDTLAAGAGDDLVAGAGHATTCGAGLDTVGELRPPALAPRDCEREALFATDWFGRFGPPVPIRLLMRNARPRVTKAAVTVRLACPAPGRCGGKVTLETSGRKLLATARLRLSGTRYRSVKLELSKGGRRILARNRKLRAILVRGGRQVPLVLRSRSWELEARSWELGVGSWELWG